MTPLRVLLADDHTLFRQGLRQICEVKGGFEVVGEAQDGQVAVRLAAELKPDVILMDISMPILDGIQAITQIMEEDRKACILALSMYEQNHHVFDAIKAGAKGYLRKNVDAALSRGHYRRRQADVHPLKRHAPVLLFAATILTTLGAGAFLAAGDPTELVEGVPFAATLLVILGCHEFSHYLVARHHGVRTSLPLFLPAPTIAGTFGAVIRLRSAIPDRRSLLEIGVAGPLGGFLAALPLGAAGLALSRVVPHPAEGGAALFELGDSLAFLALQRAVLAG